MSAKTVLVGKAPHEVLVGGCSRFVLIAGPCVIENDQITFEIASGLKEMCEAEGIPFIFKASYDKANRTSGSSYRGPGLKGGLEILARVKRQLNIPVVSDVHQTDNMELAAEILDVIQIPAFLCRQTDLIQAAAGTGKPINIKKGQFMAPSDIAYAITKAIEVGNTNVMITERGSCFGHNDLVVDYRGIIAMHSYGYPVIFDATHSVGLRELAPPLARAAVAVGVDGIFLEVHPDPDKAKCDAPNSMRLADVPDLLTELVQIESALGSSI